MCRKIVFLITFVLVLALSSSVLADDSTPPVWAGSSETGVVYWEFLEDNTYPTSVACDPPYDYIDAPLEEKFGFRNPTYVGAPPVWIAGGGYAGDGALSIGTECEESMIQPIPDGTGTYMTVYMQIVYQGAALGGGIEHWGDEGTWPGGPSDWTEWTEDSYDGPFGEDGTTMTQIGSTVDLGGDWKYEIYYATGSLGADRILITRSFSTSWLST
jgi:hypothetical protein